MSTIDLMLFGLLYQRPQSPYDLQKQIEERNLAQWMKIGSFTVYKKVVQYENRGYVTSTNRKTGKYPKKTIYELTPRGLEAFKEMMRKYSSEAVRIILDFNAVIANLPQADSTLKNECIGNIKKSIHTTKEQLEQSLTDNEQTPGITKAIIEQQYALLKVLVQWEEHFEQDFKNGALHA